MRKTKFELEVLNSSNGLLTATGEIIGTKPKYRPYVKITVSKEDNELTGICIPDKDLERFAVNILKALKSEKLK